MTYVQKLEKFLQELSKDPTFKGVHFSTGSNSKASEEEIARDALVLLGYYDSEMDDVLGNSSFDISNKIL